LKKSSTLEFKHGNVLEDLMETKLILNQVHTVLIAAAPALAVNSIGSS